MNNFPLILVLFSQTLVANDFNRPSTEMLKRGKVVFQENCMACHGEKGLGDGPASKAINPRPRNFVKDKFKYGNSPAQMFKTVSNGIEGTAMPPWKDALSEADRWSVVHYERTFNFKKNKVKSFDEMTK